MAIAARNILKTPTFIYLSSQKQAKFQKFAYVGVFALIRTLIN